MFSLKTRKIIKQPKYHKNIPCYTQVRWDIWTIENGDQAMALTVAK